MNRLSQLGWDAGDGGERGVPSRVSRVPRMADLAIYLKLCTLRSFIKLLTRKTK